MSTDIGRVRSCAGENCAIIGGFTRTETLCVLGVAPDNAQWFVVRLGEDDATEERQTGFISASLVEPGPPGTTAAGADFCDAWVVDSTQVNVRSCPQGSCSVLGSLSRDQRVCARAYSGSFTDWRAIEFQPGVMGYVDETQMEFVFIDGFSCPANQETYQPRAAAVTVYGCAGVGCAAIGTLETDQPVCSSGVESETLDWISIDYGQPGEQGWVLTRALRALTEEELTVVTPTVNPTAAPQVVAQADVNVRSDSATTASVVAILPNNTRARLVGVAANGWYLIELSDGQRGWVSPASVQVSGDVAAIPLVDANASTPVASATRQSTSVAQLQQAATNTPPAATATTANSATPTLRVVTLTPTGAASATATTASTATETATSAPPTAVPTQGPTALPACQYYQVNADSAVVREQPTRQSGVLATLQRDTAVCVRGNAVSQDENQWFLVDLNPNGTTPSLGYMATFLLTIFQGPTPTPLNSPVPTATLDTAAQQLLPTATSPLPGTPVICPTDVPTATSAPGQPTNTPGPVAPPVIVGCITATPTPLLTAQPTQYASDAVLARDIRLDTLRIRDITMRSPQGLAQFRLRIPDDWEPTGTNILYLNIEYFEDTSAVIGADFAPPVTTLDVRINDQLIASVPFTAANVGQQTLQIVLPNNVLANPVRRVHTITLEMDARDACRVRLESRMFIRADQSFVHFEYREYLPTLDLSQYPRPLFNNRRIVNEFESAWLVMPPQASAADYQASASVSAGLGLLTGAELQLRIVTSDTLNENDRQANHLLLIGRIGENPMIDDLYARNLLPTTLGDDGQLRFRDNPINPADGVVQVISNPENPRRAIFVITGQSDIALLKAAQALAGRPSVLGLGGTLAIVSDTSPLFHPPLGTVFETAASFEQLGVTEDIVLSGIGTQFFEVEFTLPFGGVLSPDAYVNVLYNYSQILAETNATFSVYINAVPIASAPLPAIGPNTPQPQGYTLRAAVPPTSVQLGATNTLRLAVDVPLDYGCEPPNREASWFTISRSSSIFLPRTSVDPLAVAPVVGLFPAPMNNLPNLQDVWVSLPTNPTPLELEQAMQLLSLLGSQTATGEGFTPRISLGPLPEGTDLSQYHFIIMGRPTTNPFLADLNPSLPQRFEPSTDTLLQTLDDVTYRLPEGFDVGVLEMIRSPWNPSRVVLVITGTTTAGQNFAANALISRNFGATELAGDVVFASLNQVIAINSAAVREIEDSLGTISEMATLSATSMVTETPLVVYTVTPGPTFTPTPTNTPGPTIPATALFTSSPPPTVVTPLASLTPRPDAAEVYPAEELELPNSVLILGGVTGGVLVIVLFYGLIVWVRRRRRAAKK
ncbi:MAG: cellulose biosynthesis cyclic di-GMP-binding regulatory protein BcsB [Chloroflexi bacterium]|nr:cellulose biosynthesis cyclic di-GMP-binding regulatory protein BcsB [Chloroflexota bacterium]